MGRECLLRYVRLTKRTELAIPDDTASQQLGNSFLRLRPRTRCVLYSSHDSRSEPGPQEERAKSLKGRQHGESDISIASPGCMVSHMTRSIIVFDPRLEGLGGAIFQWVDTWTVSHFAAVVVFKSQIIFPVLHWYSKSYLMFVFSAEFEWRIIKCLNTTNPTQSIPDQGCSAFSSSGSQNNMTGVHFAFHHRDGSDCFRVHYLGTDSPFTP